jgi:hypothetical protein
MVKEEPSHVIRRIGLRSLSPSRMQRIESTRMSITLAPTASNLRGWMLRKTARTTEWCTKVRDWCPNVAAEFITVRLLLGHSNVGS